MGCACSATASSTGAGGGADEAAGCDAGANGMAAETIGFTACGVGAGTSGSATGGGTMDAATTGAGAGLAATAAAGPVPDGRTGGAAVAGSCGGGVAVAGAALMMVRVSMGCLICETACGASASGPSRTANSCKIQPCASTTSITMSSPVAHAWCRAVRPEAAFSGTDAGAGTGIHPAVQLLTARRFAQRRCGRRATSSQSQPTPVPNPSAAPPP